MSAPMSAPTPRRPLTWLSRLGVAMLAAGVAGCGLLPDSGPIHHTDLAVAHPQEPYFSPPGPIPGASRSEIVRGFLVAMQANPIQVATARHFLTPKAATGWQPGKSVLIYQESTVTQRGPLVRVRLADAERLNARGAWAGGQPGASTTVDLHLRRERGQWRIADPPNALAVRTSFFQGVFQSFLIYFFDSTNQVLVPERVYLPRGQQTASTLIRALLAGPGRQWGGVLHSAIPRGAALDVAVVVADNGVAEVPLSPSVLHLSAPRLRRVFAQLAWTLRQVPGIAQVRITVDGNPLPLANGRISVGVTTGAAYSADATTVSGQEVGVSDGRLVSLAGSHAVSVGGPLGAGARAVRSVALSEGGDQVVAVSADGRSAYAAATSGSTSTRSLRTVVSGARDLLRPAEDRFGDVWLVDRTSQGAQVHLVGPGPGDDHVVRVPGITGRPVTAFSVSYDGARLVAALSGSGSHRLVVSGIRRTPQGKVLSVSRAEPIPLSHALVGDVVDLTWTSSTTLAMITRDGGGPSRLRIMEADGSPGDFSPTATENFPTGAVSLVAPPTPEEGLEVITAAQRLYMLSARSGRWVASTYRGHIEAASYAG